MILKINRPRETLLLCIVISFISDNNLNTERACCYALTAECLSCAAGMEIEEYCKQNPNTRGCGGGEHIYICI